MAITKATPPHHVNEENLVMVITNNSISMVAHFALCVFDAIVENNGMLRVPGFSIHGS